MREKSIKNIRQEFKEHGIFYTPPKLAKRLLNYVDIEPKTVYDPTCGCGNLVKAFSENVKKYGQELDEEQLALINDVNFIGYTGDTLMDDGFLDMKFDCIVANPPFSVKWKPDELKEDARFKGKPMPPPSKADWAFMLHILHHLSDDGVAVVLEFPGILYRGQKEGKVRQWFIEHNYIDRVVHVPRHTFEDTSIATCIVVLRKNRTTTDIIFENEKKEVVVPLQEVVANDYILSVNNYIPDEIQKEEVDIDDVNKQNVMQLLKQVDATFQSLIALSKIFDDNFYILELEKGLKEILGKYAMSEKV